MAQESRMRREYDRLKQQITDLGFVCTGSLMSVYHKCGNPDCACARDPNARHGPYNRWTRKVNGKTVTRTLTDDQAAECKRCIENNKKLQEIIANMRRLSAQYIEQLK